MKTFEDLLNCPETQVGEFCVTAIKQFESEKTYKDALDADAYYHKHNLTIERYVKWIKTITGRDIIEDVGANHKLQTQHFRRHVIRHANYLLGKGVQLEKQKEKDKLGKNFDHQILKAVKIAMVEGKSFGFWNQDHLEVFGYVCNESHAGFCPLYSEETAELKAGIRFRRKKINSKMILLFTLFEIDGTTSFRKQGSGNVEIVQPKKGYLTRVERTKAEGIISEVSENYGALPIIPMYASDTYESDLVGLRESIDCYDLIKSGLANNIDDASEIYWIIKNAGGMEDVDLAQFLQRVKNVHAASVDTSVGSDASPHTIEVPYEARKTMLEILRSDLYEDMMLADAKSLSSAQKTTQEIQSAYQSQDDYTDDLEFFVMDFLDQLFAIVGIDSEVILTRNKIVNMPEYVSMVLSASQYLSPECVIKHMIFLTPEEQEEEIAKLEKQQFEQFHADDEEEDEEDGEGDDTDTGENDGDSEEQPAEDEGK